jgi:hypothetical protein
MTLKIMEPTAIAPIYEAWPKCPAIVKSTSPSNGTVILEIIDGNAI